MTVEEITPAMNDHIDRTVDTVHAIPMDRVSILTGSNGAGKSLVRKQLAFPAEKAGLKTASTSMEARTNSNPEWGALSGMMRDSPYQPTSLATLDAIEGVFSVQRDCFVTVDEPEIGMGEETVKGLVVFLNDLIANRSHFIKGVLVITHNRYIVENLRHDAFFNLDGLENRAAWLDRPVFAVSVEELRKRSSELFASIKARSRQD